MDHDGAPGDLFLWRELLLWLPELEADATGPHWSRPLSASEVLMLLLSARRGVGRVYVDESRELLSLWLDTRHPYLGDLVADMRAAGFCDVRTWRFPRQRHGTPSTRAPLGDTARPHATTKSANTYAEGARRP